jgi:hypothetical protein
MVQTELTLTEAERDYLAKLLETTLKSTLVEEHRTRSPNYREHVVAQEQMIRDILRKLQAQE